MRYVAAAAVGSFDKTISDQIVILHLIIPLESNEDSARRFVREWIYFHEEISIGDNYFI